MIGAISRAASISDVSACKCISFSYALCASVLVLHDVLFETDVPYLLGDVIEKVGNGVSALQRS
jgi:hypothetical protein